LIVQRLLSIPILADGYTEHDSGLLFLILAGVGVLLFVVGLRFWKVIQKPGHSEETAMELLYFELCDTHDLSRAERSLVTQLARNYQLPSSTFLFIDPTLLDRAAAAADPDAPRYEALRQKLFGSNC
jgi:hypothetical protein